MSFKPLILIALLGVAATGCTPVDRGFGEALKYDLAIQTIDPEPVYGEDGAKPGDNGAVGAAASRRYRTGSVKQPAQQSTGGASGGGGAPGSSGSPPQ